MHSPVFLFVEIVLFVIAFGLLIPISVLFVECCAVLFPQQQVQSSIAVPRPRVDVLVPAHNEATGIDATLLKLLPQLTAQDRLVVIADNCDDDTATIARKVGATVLEREEPELRGKGYALDYGLQFIATDPPEVVVVVDADCIVAQRTIEQIAQQAIASARPIQARYLMHQPDNPGLKDLLSTLAVTVKNLVRPSGLKRLGLPCLLTGSGMAFPWSVIERLSLAGSKTVDDMQLALDLTLAGHAPMYCQEAQVTGRLMKQHAAVSQRTRWEHGHLEFLLTQIPHLIKESVRQERLDLFALALDLCVPPLSLLVMLWASTMMVALCAGGLKASWIPAGLLAIEGILISISVMIAWAKFSRANLPLLALLGVPLYIVWKIPIYFAFLVRPQTKWVQTERDLVKAPD